MFRKPMTALSVRCIRSYATGTSSSPPLLLKIRRDMKVAMQEKDANRLSVLRSLLSQSLNASKTSSPINTDMQMLALLRKSLSASKAASEEFKSAGRQDLADKEDSQIKIMSEYASSVAVLGEDVVTAAIREVIDSMQKDGSKMQAGEVLKRVFSAEALGDKAVDKGQVAKIVKAMLS